MSFLTNRAFWREAAGRAVKTFAQALLALAGAGALDVLHVHWVPLLSISAGAALLSVLNSVATAGSTAAAGQAKALRAAAQRTSS